MLKLKWNITTKTENPKPPRITWLPRQLRQMATAYSPIAAPKAGWWGFAALNEADFTLKADGQDKGVELGAVIWVKFEDWKTK